MTQEEQIKQVAEYGNEWDEETIMFRFPDGSRGYVRLSEMQFHTSLDWLNPVWVKVYAEAERKGASFLEENKRENWYDRYHSAINTGNISAALTAVSDAISWLKEQKK